jgi:hypothetical protein
MAFHISSVVFESNGRQINFGNQKYQNKKKKNKKQKTKTNSRNNNETDLHTFKSHSEKRQGFGGSGWKGRDELLHEDIFLQSRRQIGEENLEQFLAGSFTPEVQNHKMNELYRKRHVWLALRMVSRRGGERELEKTRAAKKKRETDANFFSRLGLGFFFFWHSFVFVFVMELAARTKEEKVPLLPENENATHGVLVKEKLTSQVSLVDDILAKTENGTTILSLLFLFLFFCFSFLSGV